MAKIFNKGLVNFGFVINQTGAQPLDSRSVVQEYADLLNPETFGKAIYNGMTVATIDEQKVYMLIDKNKVTSADGWKEVGAGGAVAVETYANAVELATNDNIGQVIFVKTSDETYERAPYIVTGEGNLQKLAASNSDGTGLDADVARLKETVGDANSGLVQAVSLKVNTSDFETYKGEVTGAIGEVSTALETYKGQVTNFLEEKATVDSLNALEKKVDEDIQDLSDHMGEYDTHLQDYGVKVAEVEGRLTVLEAFEETHAPILKDEIIGLFTPNTEA